MDEFIKDAQGGSENYEAYLLFPVHLDGTLLDNSMIMQSKKDFFPPTIVLQIFRQVMILLPLCFVVYCLNLGNY